MPGDNERVHFLMGDEWVRSPLHLTHSTLATDDSVSNFLVEQKWANWARGSGGRAETELVDCTGRAADG